MKRPALLIMLLCGLAVAQSSIGSFNYSIASDPMTDDDRSQVLTSELDRTDRLANLLYRCQANSRSKKTELFVALEHKLNLPKRYATYGRVFMQFRFDKLKASDERPAYFSEDGSRVYLPDDLRNEFVAATRLAQRVAIGLTFDDLAPQTFVFRLESGDAALRKLKCAAPR